jgi:hypothetical protein
MTAAFERHLYILDETRTPSTRRSGSLSVEVTGKRGAPGWGNRAPSRSAWGNLPPWGKRAKRGRAVDDPGGEKMATAVKRAGFTSQEPELPALR